MRALITGAAVLAVALPTGMAAGAAPGASAPRAAVTVTITAQGTDMSGTVASRRPLRCAANRTVKLYRLIDGEPHLWATDTTSKQGGKYVWSSGNTGAPGRYYARVGAKPGCRGDASRTIRVVRSD